MNAFTLIFQIVWLLAGLGVVSLTAIMSWDILSDHLAERKIIKDLDRKSKEAMAAAKRSLEDSPPDSKYDHYITKGD